MSLPAADGRRMIGTSFDSPACGFERSEDS